MIDSGRREALLCRCDPIRLAGALKHLRGITSSWKHREEIGGFLLETCDNSLSVVRTCGDSMERMRVPASRVSDWRVRMRSDECGGLIDFLTSSAGGSVSVFIVSGGTLSFRTDSGDSTSVRMHDGNGRLFMWRSLLYGERDIAAAHPVDVGRLLDVMGDYGKRARGGHVLDIRILPGCNPEASLDMSVPGRRGTCVSEWFNIGYADLLGLGSGDHFAGDRTITGSFSSRLVHRILHGHRSEARCSMSVSGRQNMSNILDAESFRADTMRLGFEAADAVIAGLDERGRSC